jgi:selenocysteine-specific elongation factor
LIDELDASPFAPPAPSDVALARALVRDGVLVDIDGVVFTANAVDRARTLIRDALRERDALSIADVRELLGSSRKYILPLLGRFDSEGITRRRGDDRVAGPAAFRDQL